MRIKLVSLEPASDGIHKYTVSLLVARKSGARLKVVKFGAKDMMDYTLYYKKDGKEVADTHRDAYIKRHSGMGEDWNNPLTAGFWSRWLLWEKPTISEALRNIFAKYPGFEMDL